MAVAGRGPDLTSRRRQLATRLVGKQALYLVAIGVQALISAALIPVLTRALSRSDYGNIALVAASQQIATTVIALGLPGLVASWAADGPRRHLERGSVLPVLGLGLVSTVVAAASGSRIAVFVCLLGTLNAVASIVLTLVATRGLAAVWAALTVAIGPLSVSLAAAAALWTGSLTAYLLTWTVGVAVAVSVSLRWAPRDWFRRTAASLHRQRVTLSLPLAVSGAAAVALAMGDRLVIGATLGTAALAPYQASYAVGNLAALAGTALTNHWLPGLMRDEPTARRDQMLSVTALATAGALVAGPALLVLLPSSYQPQALWPVAAIAALSAVPQAWFLQTQARATHLGLTRYVGVAAFVATVATMVVTLVVAVTTRSYVLIAAVTPVAYAALAWFVRRRNHRPSATGGHDHHSAPTGGPGHRAVLVLLATVRWDYLWQRHQSIAVAAADRGSVVFVESQPRSLAQIVGHLLRRRGGELGPAPTPPPPAVRLVRPTPLSLFSAGAWARAQARRVVREAGRGASLDVVLYAPTPAYLRLAHELARHGARVTYDAVVDWSRAPAHWHPPRRAREAEIALPTEWRVVSDNPALASELEGVLHRPVPVVLPAADTAFLAHSWPDLMARDHVAGWFGAVREETDIDLLCALSRAGVRVQTIGPIETPAARQRLTAAGVECLPSVPVDELPRRIDHWRVAVLAYRGARAGTITPAKLVNALVGFRVAVRGIAVPASLAGFVTALPADDAAAVAALSDLVEDPGVLPHLPAEEVSWEGRLLQITGGTG
ncbi:Membrane protein involved in the export of O-antigen and teichoic acid [Geodermatophilus telluris]|uniref:Membrane protein involved in the export of O-antigen and teichoic acid n=1 Tax=Geodermatophilus telluris TaxID=1190417 RepID=A0A1G6L6Z0_9ACTN|nr:hypothetical protein [Geodermatophilus telluris]SDC39112.1 Membrane protein involved in the export of O-antigen and teichoic acid [Geodermatophilus telluris]